MNDQYTAAAMKRFSSWLCDMLAQREMIPADLARATGKRPGVVSKWCNGTDLPRPDSAVIIAEALHVDLQSVFDAMALRARDDRDQAHQAIDPEMSYYGQEFRRLLPEFQTVVRGQLRVIYKISDAEKQNRSKLR